MVFPMFGFIFWQRWMQGVCWLVIVLGLLIALVMGVELITGSADPIDDVFFTSSLSEAERDFRAWTFGVWGATLIGWGIVLLFLVRTPFKKKEGWAWNAIAVGLVVWFVMDTGFSAFYGVNLNVIVNVMLFILALVPLLMTYMDFNQAAA